MAQRAHPATQRASAVAIHADAPAETLFITQYRCWTAGYSSRNRVCLDLAWNVLQSYVPSCCVKTLYDAFHFFAFTMNAQAQKPIAWRQDSCRCLCRDEYLALRLVAASQDGDFEEEILAATDLLGVDQIHLLLMASRSLAQALKARGFVLESMKEDEPASLPRLESPAGGPTLH